MIEYIETKSILSKLKGPDPYFGISYNMNLYRGCQHGCIYCDTRSECYGIGDISRISVKSNSLELLKKALASKRKLKGTIGTGSMNDPYMPVEKSLERTRQALKIISDARYPVHIITKSSLVARDADILKEISDIYAAVSFTVTASDDNLAGIIEPHAPPPSNRFEAMYRLAKAGIYTGVTLMPLLPFINDRKENIESIIRRAKDSGASYVLAMIGVTLRDGSRDYFYTALDRFFPGMKSRYISAYGNRYECFSPDYSALDETYRSESSKLGIATKMRFYNPDSHVLSLFD